MWFPVPDAHTSLSSSFIPVDGIDSIDDSVQRQEIMVLNSTLYILYRLIDGMQCQNIHC